VTLPPVRGLVVFGPGLSLLDEAGGVFVECADDFEPVAVAIAGDGRIFASGQPVGAPVAVLVAFSVNLIERWRTTLANQAEGLQEPSGFCGP
jgi:hypothetical protein